MFSPISDIAAADAGVQAALGTRFYSFGMAPETVDPDLGYAVWQVVGGGPENLLAGRPTDDTHLHQVDVYAKEANRARNIARALVRAFELLGYITGWNGEFIDPDTRLRRISFTVEFQTSR